MKRVLSVPLGIAVIFASILAVSMPTRADNVCYANGTSYGLGYQQCMGGWVMVCTETGWAMLGSGHRC